MTLASCEQTGSCTSTLAPPASLRHQAEGETSAGRPHLHAQGETPKRTSGPWLRIAIGCLLAGQSMVLGLAINLSAMDTITRLVLQWVVLLATVVVMVLLGIPLARTAWEGLRRRRVTVGALFITGTTGAFLASLQSMISGSGPIYFEVVSVLLVVYTVGKQVGAVARARALQSTLSWAEPYSRCRLLGDDQTHREVDSTTIQPGDRILVLPGEAIGVDGVIEEGVGFVHDTPLSGEPFARVCRPGDKVFAGGTIHDTTFRIRATTAGGERQMDRLVAAVEEARNTPTSLQGQADRLAGYFFPLVLAVALGTFLFWGWTTGWSVGLFHALSVLLVACPCALGLATPLAVWLALGRLAERGLVARRGDFVERLAAVDQVLFDKTGTLTEDRLFVTELVTGDNGKARSQLLSWLATVESTSKHPVARALTDLLTSSADSTHTDQPTLLATKVVPGAGIEAEVASAGEIHRLQVGRPEWLQSDQLPDARNLLAQLRTEGRHRIDVHVDGELRAIALLNERVRSSAKSTLHFFQKVGVPVEVLTGDTHEGSTAAGFPQAQAALLPEDKRLVLQGRMAQGGKPLFVGDGLNDSGALAASWAGIALASGSELAFGAAGAILHDGNLRTIPWAINLCRYTVRVIRQNLAWAASYNLIGMSLAAGGILHPVVAALLMVISSLFVVWSSSRVASCTPTDTQSGEEEMSVAEGSLSAP